MADILTAKPLFTIAQIRQEGIRSINVEYDLGNPDIADGYVLTAQGLACLGRIVEGLGGNSAKAWTLTGPYGSGKSFFSLYLFNLLSPIQAGHRLAFDRLTQVDGPLAEQIQEILGTT